MRFTDWGRRPLTPKQLNYALGDVTHLRIVYEELRERLNKNGRNLWVKEEMAILTDPSIYEIDPREAWKRLKVRTNKPKFLAILREVAALREEKAQHKNVPRNRIMRDDAITEIAAHAPNSRDDLKSLRALHRGQISGHMGEEILAAVMRGQKTRDEDCPKVKSRISPNRKIGPAVELIKVLLKVKCDTHGVAQKLIATSEDIESIATNDNAAVPALHGWRREIFGEDALALKRGQLAMTTDGNKIRMIKSSD